MKSKQITIVGLSVAAAVVLGLIVYPLFPAPLLKLVLLAPFLGLTIAIPLLFYRRPVVLVYTAASLAAILMFFSVFMGAAILSAGLSAYLFTRLVLRECDTPARIVIAAASFPALGFISAFLVIYYLMDVPLVKALSMGTMAVLFVLTTALGGLGAHFAVRIFGRHSSLPR
jgi:hypothetical protein